MATIKFFLRSNLSNESPIYFRYRPSAKMDMMIKTPYSIEPKYWDAENQKFSDEFYVKGAKSTEQKKLNDLHTTINNKLGNVRTDFSTFMINNPHATKAEIKSHIEEKYFAQGKPKDQTSAQIPEKFSDFVDYYIEEKSVFISGAQIPITDATRKKLITIKNKVKLFKPKLLITEINDDFRKGFAKWMQKEKFSQSTIIKTLKYIKTICVFAHENQIDINGRVLHWKFTATEETITPPVLSLQEIKQIQQTILPKESLENARDWLIIGCYTGARVSDLLNFGSGKIIEESLLEFTQKKTTKKTIIYLFPEVMKILEKRGGKFPRKISDQKFNEYLKEVCKIAGINQKMIGGIKDKKAGKHGKKIVKEYEKWEIVSSHICRRSFVTNYIAILGKDVKSQTGRQTDSMMKLYDKTEQIEKALRVKDKIENHLKIV